MKAARIVVLGVALVAGVGAAMLAGGSNDEPPAPAQVAQAPALKTVDVLVAANDVAIGSPVRTEDLRWQVWPEEAANAAFLQKAAAPNAIEETVGSIARTPFAAGEPIRPEKLIKANGSGYMAAILPAGMRAISIEISAETGAGGFILPNDRVDVILSKRTASESGDTSTSETICRNIRVLAIDQAVEDKDGEKVVVGKTATLELTPSQSEQIALSRTQGAISLALRSIVDSSPTAPAEAAPAKQGVVTVRYGVTSAKSQ